MLMGKGNDTLDDIVSKIPYFAVRRIKWKLDEGEYQEIIDGADNNLERMRQNYATLNRNTEQTLEKKTEASRDIKRLKKKGSDLVQEYWNIDTYIKSIENEVMSTNDDEENRLESEDRRDDYAIRKEHVSKDIVHTTTKIKYLKERVDSLLPIYERLKQKLFSFQEDIENADYCYNELIDEVDRCTNDIRTGIKPYRRIRRLYDEIERLAKDSEVSYIADVKLGALNDHSKDLEELGLSGKKERLTNDEYVGNCIDFLEQTNKEYDF